jgi:nucleoside-diphosphate-sugar epimerase
VIYGDDNFASSLCYIDDCVDAVLKIASTEIVGPVNIGSDIAVKLSDLAKKIIVMIGSDSKIKYDEKLIFMSQLSLPDINKARNELGWMPVISLEKGLERTIYELRASKGLKGVGHEW